MLNHEAAEISIRGFFVAQACPRPMMWHEYAKNYAADCVLADPCICIGQPNAASASTNWLRMAAEHMSRVPEAIGRGARDKNNR